MADDQQNPYTVMGMMKMMMPNPYESAQFKDKPMQLQGYRGPATDAMGRPIQSFVDAQAQHDAWDQAHPAPQGTTLNSAPGLEAQGSQGRAMQDAGYGDWAMLDPTMAQANRPNPTAGAGSVGATSGWNPSNPASKYPTAGPMAGGGSNQANSGQSGPSQTNPIDMRQAYLDALSNPGNPKMGGATVPQSQPLGSPNVMDAFLAQHSGGSKAGNYDNSEFFNTLKNLRGVA